MIGGAKPMRTKIAGVLYVLKTILRSLFYKQKSLGRIDQGFFFILIIVDRLLPNIF